METRKTKNVVLPLTIVVATVLLGLAALRSVQAVAGLSAVTPNVAVALTGAIYTTNSTCGKVNGNLFNLKSDVYLNGGPQGGGAGLLDGSYYVMVTEPGGNVLGKTLTASAQVTNGAFVQCYQLTAILYSTSSGFTSLGYDDTQNNGGEYKVWVSPSPDFSEKKTDNFKVRGDNSKSVIGGVKYNDTNANGTFDAGELGIEGVTIQVTLGNDPMHPITTQTDKDGIWSLVFPAGTTYTACEMLLAPFTDYTQTGPIAGTIANNVSNTLAATANPSKCWGGIVTNADTASLNFYNVVCTPKITCPDDITVECDSKTTPNITGAATAKDNCGATLTPTYEDSFAPGSCGITGVLTRTWTVKDDLGHTDSCVQKITIVDTTKPTISSVGVAATIECPATPVFSTPTASDNCGDAKLTFADVRTEGTCAGTYSITRTWTATDACLNSSTASQTITVEDKTPPMLNNDAGASGVIYCPTTPVFTPPTATDSCSTATVFVVSDETTQGTCGTYIRKITWGARDACLNVSKDTRSQTLEVRCNSCGEGTMGFWQNKNGQAIITTGAATAGVANSGTWLRNFAPFQDLSATASPSQVATYVTNIIKAASASGTSMNAMLKAQMLSTALDVYFGKVNGNANIDLKYINKPIGSATYENVSSSFGGASCMSVKNMLIYAASRSNVGGSDWYGQVKNGPNSQELAKDAFDAINNQKAFSVFSCP